MTCQLGCYDCSGLCLCRCHKKRSAAPVMVDIDLYDKLLDMVAKKEKIFYSDIRELKLYDIDKIIKFLHNRNYVLVGDVFLYGDKI